MCKCYMYMWLSLHACQTNAKYKLLSLLHYVVLKRREKKSSKYFVKIMLKLAPFLVNLVAKTGKCYIICCSLMLF